MGYSLLVGRSIHITSPTPLTESLVPTRDTLVSAPALSTSLDHAPLAPPHAFTHPAARAAWARTRACDARCVSMTRSSRDGRDAACVTGRNDRAGGGGGGEN